MRIVCLGLGYVARRTLTRLTLDHQAVGTVRDPARAAPAPGVSIMGFDGGAVSGDLAVALDQATHVLVSIPPDGTGCPAATAAGARLKASRSLAWLGYLSTTGVYGDQAGGWCFEEDAPAPDGPRGAARVVAERAWADTPRHVFRLPGIYGPGRGPLTRAGAPGARAWLKPGLVFNRAHVDDIADALIASMRRPGRDALFNVADDAPAPPHVVTNAARAVLGLAPLRPEPFDPAVASPMLREFYAASKRVSNARLKAALGWRPRYPSYREGLAACAASS